MKKVIYLVFIFSVDIFAQNQIIVIKDQNNRPVPFANVFYNGNYGIQTDSLGRFKFFKYEKPHQIDVFKTGYTPVSLSHKTFDAHPEIILTKLPAIQGKIATNAPEITIGFHGKDKQLYHKDFVGGNNLPRNDRNYEGGNIFEYIDEYNGKILSKVRLYAFVIGQSAIPFRLNVYCLNEDRHPNENLLKKEIFFTPTSKKQWYELNLEDQNIIFPESGIAITIEALNSQLKRVKFSEKSRPVISRYKTNEFQWVYRAENWATWQSGTETPYAFQLSLK